MPVQRRFDTLGNLVEQPVPQRVSRSPPRPATDRLHRAWQRLGKNARFQATILFGCVGCFSAVYFTALHLEDRYARINGQAVLPAELRSRAGWDEFRYRRLQTQWDNFAHFQS